MLGPIGPRQRDLTDKNDASNEKNSRAHKENEAASNCKAGKNRRLFSIKKSMKPGRKHADEDIESTQMDDDDKDSQSSSQLLPKLCRERRNDGARQGKMDECMTRTQTREEEPSTLEGVASITRDDAPSAVSMLRPSMISVQKCAGMSKKSQRTKLKSSTKQ
ncbi:unnamed protein product [Thelazia callipaeda]|uniref:Shugoshin C-terminal domain-containing protein n=1 Tax=Thelazia callipaeda TaxID=103827 RepID=A0A0N5CWK0_THECL|nr:unnamed protein product [Thelazia callipaeda]